MGKTKNFEQVALKRFEILGPLVGDELDPAKRAQLLRQASERYEISERTIRRWLSAYTGDGFQGLIPRSKAYAGPAGSVNESILDEAVILRREVPTRSVAQLIRILELEDKITPGTVKRSTLQEHLLKRGYGARQLQMFASSGVGAARRFAKRHRNQLWQCDLKYLLVLPETAARPALQLYSSVFIDDASRSIMSCRVYEQQDNHCVLDCFRHALEENGIPDAIYTDNGKQYTSKQLTQVCAKLGIKMLRAKPYAAASKGKVEAFNKYLDRFVAEVKLKKPQTAAEVEHYLKAWVQVMYQQKVHSALDGKTPEQAFQGDTKLLRFASQANLNFAFQFTEQRLVDKTGCISFQSRPWEAGQDLIGMRVDVSYHADNPDMLTVCHPSCEPRPVRPLVITEYSAPRKHLPIPGYIPPKTSRELDAVLEKHRQDHRTAKAAISFADFLSQTGEEADHV